MKKSIAIFIVALLVVCVVPFTACKKDDRSVCSSYDITCSFDGEKITGEEKVVFYNDTDKAFSELNFNLFMNAYREGAKYSGVPEDGFYDGESYGDIKIEKVCQNGENIDFEIGGEDENLLIVKLNEKVASKKSVEVEVAFTTTFSKNISRTGITPSTVNMCHFYPILCGISNGEFYECKYYQLGDPFFSDCANYNVTLTLDNEYKVASSGQLKNETNKNDKNTYTYSIEKARSFCFVVSKEFNVKEDTSSGVDVKYYYLDDGKSELTLDLAVRSIKTFSEMFGEYPYKTLSVVETPFDGSGMEYPALVYVQQGLLDETNKDFYNGTVIHEIAHEWWSMVVGNNEIEYPFLDEGLAEYSVALFYEKNADLATSFKEKYDVELKASSREDFILDKESDYFSIIGGLSSISSKILNDFYAVTKMTYPISFYYKDGKVVEYGSNHSYIIAYVKATLLQENLRKKIGDEKYFEGIKNYYKDFAFKNATPSDLSSEFAKLDIQSKEFFDDYYKGKDDLFDEILKKKADLLKPLM